MNSIELLKKMGLTEYESKVYAALAKIGPSKVSDIVAESDVPRNKAYESLSSLEKKQKIVSLPLKPIRYKISNVESWEEDLEKMSKTLTTFIEEVGNQNNSKSKDSFWVIKSKKAIEEKLALVNQTVKREILACNNLSKILYKNIREMENAIKRGVKVKIICSFDKSKTPSYKEWLSTGAQIRVFNHKMFGPLLPRIGIFDEEKARLTIGKPEVQNEEDYITLWIESPAFTTMLRKHFLNMWKNSKPLKEYLKLNY